MRSANKERRWGFFSFLRWSFWINFTCVLGQLFKTKQGSGSAFRDWNGNGCNEIFLCMFSTQESRTWRKKNKTISGAGTTPHHKEKKLLEKMSWIFEGKIEQNTAPSAFSRQSFRGARTTERGLVIRAHVQRAAALPRGAGRCNGDRRWHNYWHMLFLCYFGE